jgi:hypothetical protein
MTQILEVMPVAWQEKLNTQVEIHTKKFTPPQPKYRLLIVSTFGIHNDQ